MNDYVVRLMHEEDTAFIYSTWLRSFKFNSDFAKPISSDIYYDMHHKLIDRIMNRYATVYVACDREHPEIVFGYICGEGDVVHFAYVKKSFRRLGIGTLLLETYGMPKYISHLTKDGKKFLSKHTTVQYSPYLT